MCCMLELYNTKLATTKNKNKNKIIINQRPEKCFERDRNLSVTAD